MNIILIGAAGKMGREIVKCLPCDDQIVQKIDVDNMPDMSADVDVIIDFSTAKDRASYIDFATKNRVPYCCFATGISDEDMSSLKKLSQRVPVLVCSNASVGVNLMFEIADIVSKKVDGADIVLTEYHHKSKKDTPSGTAKKLEEIISLNGKNVKTNALRVGNECGTHVLQFFFEDEILEIKHIAKSRKIFALGAIKMARSVCKRKKGLHTK